MSEFWNPLAVALSSQSRLGGSDKKTAVSRIVMVIDSYAISLGMISNTYEAYGLFTNYDDI